MQRPTLGGREERPGEGTAQTKHGGAVGVAGVVRPRPPEGVERCPWASLVPGGGGGR